MDDSSPSPSSTRSWPELVAVGAAALGFVGSAMALFAQVEVSDDAVGATRTCGSPFDVVVDRSGWEQWWARDLDEPDRAIREALVRTQLCPDDVNFRLGIAFALAALSCVILLVVTRRRRRARPERSRETTVGRRVAALGRVTAWTGAFFAVAGFVAVVVLVADADSTLFLYTDRVVVGVVGLIVLVPTIALFAIGRVLQLVAPELDRPDELDRATEPDRAEKGVADG